MGIRIYNQMAGGLYTNSSGGVTLPTGQFLAPDGTVAAPSYSFANNSNTGWYSAGAGTGSILFSANGVLRMYLDGGGPSITGSYRWGASADSPDVSISRSAAGIAKVSSGLVCDGPTQGLGYTTGAGTVITQNTSKSTGMTMNTVTGAITMNNAALGASALVSFTVTNSAVGVDDAVIVNHQAVGTLGAYRVGAHTITAGSFKIGVFNQNGSSLSEAIVLRYTIIKGASA